MPSLVTPAHVEDAVVVKIITPTEKNALPGKLAEAELHFTEGILDGLKLIGFTPLAPTRSTGSAEASRFSGPRSAMPPRRTACAS